VNAADRVRWTLLSGSSRRLLPGLVRELTHVDLFVHDSMHTGRNVSFELDRIWPALADGGAALVDDVQQNAAFGRFVRSHPDATSFLHRADDGGALFGILLKGTGHARLTGPRS
jgi:Methyltransferase domain